MKSIANPWLIRIFALNHRREVYEELAADCTKLDGVINRVAYGK